MRYGCSVRVRLAVRSIFIEANDWCLLIFVYGGRACLTQNWTGRPDWFQTSWRLLIQKLHEALASVPGVSLLVSHKTVFECNGQQVTLTERVISIHPGYVIAQSWRGGRVQPRGRGQAWMGRGLLAQKGFWPKGRVQSGMGSTPGGSGLGFRSTKAGWLCGVKHVSSLLSLSWRTQHCETKRRTWEFCRSYSCTLLHLICWLILGDPVHLSIFV